MDSFILTLFSRKDDPFSAQTVPVVFPLFRIAFLFAMSAIVFPPQGDRRTSRPVTTLTSIPNWHDAGPSKGLPFPLPSPPSLYHAAPHPGASALNTSYTFSSFMPAPAATLSRTFQEPRVLTHFLRRLQWHDFWSFTSTCTSFRNMLGHSKLRDAVLSAFVPGYQYCLRHADLSASGDIEVRFSDLNYFSGCRIYFASM